jgi:hypothetical protein
MKYRRTFQHVCVATLVGVAIMLPATSEGKLVVEWATFPVQWHLNRSGPRFPTTPIADSVARIADDAELTVGPRYYPPAAKQRREEGDCVVSLEYQRNGRDRRVPSAEIVR